MKTEAKIGIFTIIGLALLITVIVLLGDFSLQKEYSIFVKFEDVSGLPVKSIVKLSGVDVGKVREISVEGDDVIVHLAVHDGVKIYKDSKFEVAATSVIGSNYLRITQGKPSSGVLAPDSRVYGISKMGIEDILVTTMKKVNSLIDTINQNGQFGKQLNDTMVNVRELTAKLNDLVAVMQQPMKDSMENIKDLTMRLDSLTASAHQITDSINNGDGAVGALINDEEMKEQVEESLKNVNESTLELKKLLKRVGGFRTYWVYEQRYDPKADVGRSDVGLRVMGQPGRYYYLGISNVGNKDDRAKGRDHVKQNTFDARLGWYGDFYDVYAGLIYGAGGFGISLNPFYKTDILNNFSVFGEASDFARDRIIRGRDFTKPRYDLGVRYSFNKYLDVGVRWADIAETGHVQYTARINFSDRDISYLLGLVTLGTMRATGD